MIDNKPLPSFNEVDSENLFLGSSFGLHTYGDLKSFEHFFLQFLFDFDHDFEKPIGFMAPSSDTLIFAIAACWNLGIPFVPFSPDSTAQEISKQLENLETGLVFTDEAHQTIIDWPNQIDIKHLDIQHTLHLDINLSEEAKNYPSHLEPEHVFGYFFTSGTSGTPKIVPLKRRQMLLAADASANNFKPRPNYFWLLCLPLNHVGGISIILRSLLYGSAIFRMKSFHPKMITTFLSENELFQAASVVPTMLRQLLENPDFHVHKTFKAILLGGGPVDSEMIKKSYNRSIPLVPSYGMTETCAQIAANPILKPQGKYIPLNSVGKIFPPNEIEIRDKDNNTLIPNDSGEIWIKGSQIFDGYLNRDKTQDFDEQGWFKTGDFGHLNSREHLFIESRGDDLIITGGENVFPQEVEAELRKIDPVKDAAVLGLQDKKWGQKVAAVVVAKAEMELPVAEIQEQLKKRMISYKVPKEMVQVDKLPRTDTGKLRRTELLKLFE